MIVEFIIVNSCCESIDYINLFVVHACPYPDHLIPDKWFIGFHYNSSVPYDECVLSQIGVRRVGDFVIYYNSITNFVAPI